MKNSLKHYMLALLCATLPAIAHSHGTTAQTPPAADSLESLVPAGKQQLSRLLALAPGDRASLGNGWFQTYQVKTSHGRPYALGVMFPKATLSNLPTEPTDGQNCWDANEDSEIDLPEECTGGHQRTLFFESNLTPFKWISINWEPHGHVEVGVYLKPHFDFHFYTMDYISRNQIAVGPCAGTIDCTHYDKAIVPIPEMYIHPDFFNTKLAFARMGNHWADGTSPEFHGHEFTHTFILGSYDGHTTFFEPMISLDYLKSQPDQCAPIKQPKLYETEGYYPTQYCTRYHELLGMYTVSLEAFIYRKAN